MFTQREALQKLSDEIRERLEEIQIDFKKERTREFLQEKIQQFLATLPREGADEWYCSDREVGETVLDAFLWWLYPALKPQDLAPWNAWPMPVTED